MRGFWSRKPAAATGAAPVPERPGIPAQRKPRILIAGEFSAGKTRLINGLLNGRVNEPVNGPVNGGANGSAGSDVLPSNVTATALPPVWLVRGEPALIRIGFSGRGEPIADLGAVDLEKTQYCALAHPSAILVGMDIIDTPGNSDPNMAAETWQRMLTFADAVVWCTNATQAWRQSEKAVWQAMPARLRQNATLVVTHADLLASPAMAERVLQRVQREAADFFDTFLMASLLDQADLDRIAAHLRRVSDTLRPEGAPNRLISDFAASIPVRNPVIQAPPVQAGADLQEPPLAGSPPVAVASMATPARETGPTGQAVTQPVATAAGAPDGASAMEAASSSASSSAAQDITAAPAAITAASPAAIPAALPTVSPTALPPASRRGGGATVLSMVRPRMAEAEAAAGGVSDDATGPARALWSELSKSVDRTDPASVLAAVEHLISRLDARSARAGTLNSISPGGSGPVAEICE